MTRNIGPVQAGSGRDIGPVQTSVVVGASVSITAGRFDFGQPVAYADAVLNKRALFDFGQPVALSQTVLVSKGNPNIQGQNALFTEVVSITRGVLNLVGKSTAYAAVCAVGKGILRFSRPVTFTSAVAKLLHRLNIGSGVSFKKGVGFKKVGEKDVSSISNPEDQ